MRYFLISISISILILSCQLPVKDSSSPAIDSGLKRVETIICNNHAVGENGCLFPDGVITGDLDIYAYFSGTLLLVSSNCNVDKKVSYNISESEWVKFNLKDLVGEKLSSDCVISILQTPNTEDQERLEFPLYPLKGTITLGRCPNGVVCDSRFTQERFSVRNDIMSIGADGLNKILVQACGETVFSGEFTGEINLSLSTIWPQNTSHKGNSGCLFVVGVRGVDNDNRYKFYNKIWYYDDNVLTMSAPSVTVKNNNIRVIGDKSTLYTITDGKYSRGNTCKIKKKGVRYVRFYTSAGRTMVVKFNDGVVEWIK